GRRAGRASGLGRRATPSGATSAGRPVGNGRSGVRSWRGFAVQDTPDLTLGYPITGAVATDQATRQLALAEPTSHRPRVDPPLIRRFRDRQHPFVNHAKPPATANSIHTTLNANSCEVSDSNSSAGSGEG